jgi:acyl-CoA thioesterase-1
VSKLRLAAWPALAAVWFAGCGGCREAERPVAAPAPSAAAPAAELRRDVGQAAPAPEDGVRRVVFLGDSLTAGLGLEEEQAFPARVAELLRERGKEIHAINAGVSGDTSAGGLARLDWLLRQDPDVVVVELGANDGLRGQPAANTEANLRQIATRVRAAGAHVLLVGLQVPPNYGPQYAREFAEIYPKLAAELDLPLVPFLLEGVGGDPALNLPDGIHPTAAGHERVAATVLPYLESVLAKLD